MTLSIPDQEQRNRAIEPDDSFIVQAPAGSGKTGLLIQRYLRLLALVEAPEEIVAITFTRKAAAEMQGRILDALEGARSGERSGTAHGQRTLELAGRALEHAGRQGWHLAENPGRLRIQTIDSLCAALSRQMPLLSRLGGLPEVVEDPAPLYERAAVATLVELDGGAAWAAAIARLLGHLDNDLPRLKQLIADMLARRDQWLRYVLDNPGRGPLERALENLAVEKMTAARLLLPPETAAELCGLMHYASVQLEAVAAANFLRDCRDLPGLPSTAPADLERWRGIAELLLTRQGTWRNQYNRNTGFPPAGGKTPEAAERAGMKQRMQALVDRLAGIGVLREALAAVQCLPPTRYSDEEWEVIESLCRLLALAAGQLQLIFAGRNQTDFAGVAQAALEALGPDEAPTDLALYLDYQVRHLLVDEFQDISVNQLALLERLTAGWPADGDRSLFLVGDPMQSIYRFREADVGNFIRTFHERRLGQVGLIPLVLSANFRSEKGIVDWINGCFARVFAAADDPGTGAVTHHASVAVQSDTGPDTVRIHPFIDDDGSREAGTVIELVADLRRRQPGDSLAILVRNRSHLARILPALRQADIPVGALDIETLATRPAIQDLYALTRAWLQPADRIAWLSVLRAPWCGLDLASLLAVCRGDRHGLITDACRDPDVLDALAAPARVRLTRLMALFGEFQAQRMRRPLRRTIESIWCRLGGPATLADAGELANTEAYFELLEKLDRGGDLESLGRLEQGLADLYAVTGETADGAVQIMTIHKAKGLEFDHVILPSLGRVPRNPSPALLNWTLRPRAAGGHDLLMGTIKAAGSQDSPVYSCIMGLEKTRDRYEDARLLYVAATRARKTLHLMGSARRRGGGESEADCAVDPRSLLNHAWPVVAANYRAAITRDAASAPAATAAPPAARGIRRLAPAWRLPDVPVTVESRTPGDGADIIPGVEYAWAGETIRQVGTVVHRCMQWLAEDSGWRQGLPATRDSLASLFTRHGVPDEDLDWACAQVETALAAMLEDPRGRWILSPAHTDQRNEFALSGIYRQRLINVIIDRTFVDESGTRWIIDYKTSRHEGGDLDAFLDSEQERYAPQLERYALLMQALDDCPIRMGLYFPLLQGWREWGKGE